MNLKEARETTHHVWPAAGLIVALALGITGCVLFYLNRNTPVPASWGAAGGARNDITSWFNVLQMGVIVPLVSGIFGVLILRRRIAPVLGVLFCCLSLGSSAMAFMPEYAILGAYTRSAPLPGTQFVAWISNFIWIIVFALALVVLALFPNGRFHSRRWRQVVVGCLALFVIPLLVGAVIETPLSSAYQIANPFVSSYPEWLYNILFGVGVVAMLVSVIVVLAAVVPRFRRSRGRERQQMKWLLSGVALMALAVIVGFALRFGFEATFGDLLVNGALLWPLSGIGVALVRHQLFDIDIIIRRTLQYAVVSALLALVYFASVVVLQGLFTSVAGARSPVVVVVSTLVIAALFNPLRRRVQDAIDRRFYRKKYVAQQVLAQFAQTCRDETDVGRLSAELTAVIQETLEPQMVTVWLRK